MDTHLEIKKEEEINDNEVILVYWKFQVQELVLDAPFLTEDNDQIVLAFSVLSRDSFFEFPKFSDGKFHFSHGKTVLLPVGPDEPLLVNVAASLSDLLLGYCDVRLDEPTRQMVNGDVKTMECCYALLDVAAEDTQIGKITLRIAIKCFGPAFIDPHDSESTAQPSEPEMEQATEKASNKDVFTFKTKKTSEGARNMVLELKAPKENPKPKIPLYHEDVAVQTDKIKGLSKGGKKKK